MNSKLVQHLVKLCIDTLLSNTHTRLRFKFSYFARFQVRCVSMLTIPTFCGRTGRSVLRALVVAMVLAGPVNNLAFNGKEFVRVFSCSASLVYNMTKTRVVLMVSPFQEAIFGIKVLFDNYQLLLVS